MMDLEEDKDLDSKIDFAEKRVLICQKRVIEQKDKANQEMRKLEREAKSLEEIKKEWIRKKSLEEERFKLEVNELRSAHRHVIEDMRVKYERERENKCRELKQLIEEEEKEVRDWQRKRADAMLITRTEEAKIKAQFQVKINALLKDEQSASRKGVVKQRRLLEAPNVFSINLDKSKPYGMKKNSGYGKRRGF